VGLNRKRLVSLDSVARIVAAPEHEIVAADIAARSLTLARDSSAMLPLDARRNSSIALIAFTAANDLRAGAALADEMTKIYGRGVMFTRLDETLDGSAYDSAVARAKRADATVFATFLVPISGQGYLSVPERARRLATTLHDVSKRMMVVSFGDPYNPAVLAGASTYLLAWQPRGEASQRAVARAIAGRVAIPGKMPIDLRRALLGGLDRPAFAYGLAFAEPADVGMNADLLARVDTIINVAITEGAAPGVALAVGRHGKLVKLRGYGSLDWRPGYPPVTDSTIYDLASLTKVIATTSALMMLIDDRLVSLDDPVARHIREWRGSPAKERVTIRNLLLHNSGLPAYGPLWRELQGRDQYRRRLGTMSLEYEPGTRTVYSDFGIILLGMIVEQVSGKPLDVFLQSRLFGPLGMRDTGFNPLTWPYAAMDVIENNNIETRMPEPIISRIAPTEVDTVFRMRHIRGQVHDENAFAIGGVSGHAGLFSSVRDLSIFAQMMLNKGFYNGRRFIDPATVELFTQRASASSSRALGWDTPEASSSAGSLFSPRSFGHTGFTGTSIWIDPERDVFVILLTNRVNPTRDNQRHVPLRRDVADAVQRAIINTPAPPGGDRHP
jgi:beta-N-acetylhexosaminidase